jgi:hypothetical protein
MNSLGTPGKGKEATMARKQLLEPGRDQPGAARKIFRIKAAAILAGAVFAALQVVPGPAKTNPPVVPGRAIEANQRLTGAVSGLIQRACADCHSHQTRWPWYSRVAPLSWQIAQDVNSARRAMNFSEWSIGVGRSPGTAVGTLAAACANVKSGRMPLTRYLLLHPEARLSPRDQAMFCEWTGQEIARLLSEKHQAERLEEARVGRRGEE